MSRKRGLGKGLEALLGNEAAQDTMSSTSQTIAISDLEPNPFQPRKTFSEESIASLADSILQHGVIQPLAVRQVKNGYEIIAGERRLRAAKRAGLKQVPVIIHEISDSDSAIFALIENIQREDLNVIEKAKGIKALIGNFNLTHEACGKVLGQSRSSISNALRLLDLSDVVQEALIENVVDMGHARALLSLEKSDQHDLLEQIRIKGLSVRETEELVRGVQEKEPNAKKSSPKTEEIKVLEKKMGQYFESKISLAIKDSGEGKLSINFDNKEIFEKILEKLGIE